MKKEIDTASLIQDLKKFEETRKEQFLCAKEIRDLLDEDKKHIILTAPVKSGKKIISQILGLLSVMRVDYRPYSYIQITSLNRNDNKVQRKELEKYNVKTFNINEKDEIAGFINYEKSKSKIPIIIYDESDYGSGSGQLFDSLTGYIHKNCGNVKFIFVSATNNEIIYSEFGKENCEEIYFEPNESYKGIKWFIDKDLIKEPGAFFDKTKDKYSLNEHSKSIIASFINQNKPILTIRLAYGKVGLIKAENILSNYIKQEFSTKVDIRIINKNKPFSWSVEEDSNDFCDWYRTAKTNIKTIILLQQTCIRSTEISICNGEYFHDYCYAWHDYRGKTTTSSTIHQAFRFAHYHDVGKEMFVYMDKEDLQHEVNRTINPNRKPSNRITVEKDTSKGKVLGTRIFDYDKDIISDKLLRKEYLDNICLSLNKELGLSYDIRSRTVSGNKERDECEILLNKTVWEEPEQYSCTFVDKPSSNYEESFNRLKIEQPNYINKCVVFIIGNNDELGKIDPKTTKKSTYVSGSLANNE